MKTTIDRMDGCGENFRQIINKVRVNRQMIKFNIDTYHLAIDKSLGFCTLGAMFKTALKINVNPHLFVINEVRICSI